MNYKINDTGVITFDSSSSKVKLVDIDTYPASGMRSDYWFEYLDDETNRPLVHPDFGKDDMIKSSILLPEGLVYKVFTKDSSIPIVISEEMYATKRAEHLNTYLEKNRDEADRILKTIEDTNMSKELIISQIFN